MIKIRQKAMYNDATLNPTSQILVNLYHTCLISATRMTAYVRSWRKGAGSRRNDIFLQSTLARPDRLFHTDNDRRVHRQARQLCVHLDAKVYRDSSGPRAWRTVPSQEGCGDVVRISPLVVSLHRADYAL